MYEVVTARIVYAIETHAQAMEDATHYKADGTPVAIYDQQRRCLYESHPDECLFCDNPKPFCTCEED